MARRIHIPQLSVGDILLDPIEAHHIRDVLRMQNGAAVEVFDDAGAVAQAVLLHLGPRETAVRISHIEPAADSRALQWTVASAVPKGERADWMVEKLSELGAAAFIPLAAARSVVLPQGQGKRERWMRIATESAKQSRRAGVMRIEELTSLADAIKNIKGHGWFFATEIPGIPIAQALVAARKLPSLTMFIGPEGGWKSDEIAAFSSAGLTAVRLGRTILRIETAAIAAAAVISSA